MPAGAVSSLLERLESTRLGRDLISAFVVITLFCMVTANLPDSELRRQAAPVTDRYLATLGLDQSWGVFAPDPRREVIELEGRVAYAAAGAGVWRPPESGALFGAYRDYRWRKFFENAVSPAHRELWQPTSAFAVRELRTESDHGRPIGVSLVRRFYQLLPPGKDPDRGPWQEVRYYHQDVSRGVPGGDGQ